MPRRPDKPVSLGRRSFFRQFLASALNEAEKAGAEFARTHLALGDVLKPAVSAPAPRAPEPYTYEPEQVAFGPPWPPPAGPPVPLWLQQKLRQQRRNRPGTVSRSARLHDAGESSPI